MEKNLSVQIARNVKNQHAQNTPLCERLGAVMPMVGDWAEEETAAELYTIWPRKLAVGSQG